MTATLSVINGPTVAPGDAVLVQWATDAPDPNDWLAVYPVGAGEAARVNGAGANNGAVLTGGAASGNQRLSIPLGTQAGPYEVRFHAAGTYVVTASATFAVAAPAPGGPVVIGGSPPPASGGPGGFNLSSLTRNPLVVGGLALLVAAQLGLIGGRRR